MVKNIIYPNYINYYYYTPGSKVIKLVRKIGSEVVYKTYLEFDTKEQAENYFKNDCGA